MKHYTIGVDIGGTNTDVVLLDEHSQIVGCHKETTSKPVEKGVVKAIGELLLQNELLASAVSGIFLGTTHATNAILEAKELLGVGLVRIAGHRPDASPCFFWPTPIQEMVLKGYECIDGGFECHGEPITPFDRAQAKEAISRLLAKKAKSIAVVGCFSSVNAEHEQEVASLVAEMAGPDFALALSHEIGGIGFLERENATLLNASLKQVIGQGFCSLQKALQAHGINAPLYMVQNDGSIMDIAMAIKMPILTIAAGQTNSFIGGCKVAGVDRAIVVDIGGTSTDIGTVVNGIPKRSCHATNIGGIQLQFAMPDVLSLALGGGSIIRNGAIGPQSVARRLKEEAQCFGGTTLTFTDVGVVLGVLDIPGAIPNKVKLSTSDAKALLAAQRQKLLYSLEVAKGKERDLPVVVVGGASALVKAALDGEALIIPQHSSVANAYGAALAEISATTTIVAPLAHNREALLDKLKAKTCQEAINKGADAQKTRIANIEIIPYAYSQEGLAKVSVTALGPRS